MTPKLKIIAGVFELEKPYFNLDANNVDRELGVQRLEGRRVLGCGRGDREPQRQHRRSRTAAVGITGPNLAADGVGSVAVGQPRLMYVATANYALPWWPAASLDVRVVHIWSAPESVDNAVYTRPATSLTIGGRYKFTAFGRNSTLRVQVQNVLATNLWQQLSTPGVFQ